MNLKRAQSDAALPRKDRLIGNYGWQILRSPTEAPGWMRGWD